jgi:hypothetical protein
MSLLKTDTGPAISRMNPKPQDESNDGPQAKNDTGKAKSANGTETDRTGWQTIIWSAFTVLLFWLAQIVDSHRLFSLALPLELFGVACSAWVLFVNLRNHPSTYKNTHLYVTSYIVIGFLVSIGLLVLEKTRQEESATVYQKHIQLATDNELIRTGIIVYNPSEHPVYDATLRIAIKQLGIPAGTILINPDEAPRSQTNFLDIPIDTFRVDVMSSTNTHPDIVYFRLGIIPAKSERDLRISGSLKTNSWADLSVIDSKAVLAIHDWQSNMIRFGIAGDSAIWKDYKGIRFPLTNIPFGGILFTNGRPVFTNLPHLRLALDTPDILGTNRFSLTNDFIIIKSNCVNITEATGLLMIPSDKPAPKQMLKLWLLNDSDIGVTNIEVVLTSLRGSGFTTNEFWHDKFASSNDMVDSLVMRWDSLAVNKIRDVSPISFADSRSGSALQLIGICINANDMPQKFVSFWLTFVPSNVLPKPVLSKVMPHVVISNNNQFISFEFVPAEYSVEQSGHEVKANSSNEQVVLILIIFVVALVVISVIIYAIRT